MASNHKPDFDDSEAFTETSVLIELVQLGRHADCYDLFYNSNTDAVASGTVVEEFDRVRKRRHSIHRAMLNHAKRGDLDDFEPPSGLSLTGNDRRYLADLLVKLSNLDSPEEVVRRLRRRKERTNKAKSDLFENPQSPVREINPGSDPNLLGNLKTVIDNEDDAAVVTGAALWSENGGSGMLLTNDRGDMIDLEGEINDTIHWNRNGEPLLITDPETFLEYSAV